MSKTKSNLSIKKKDFDDEKKYIRIDFEQFFYKLYILTNINALNIPRPKKRARHLKNAANLRWNNQLNEGTSMSSCDINENGRSQMIDTGNISDQSSQYEGSTDEETEDILEYNVFDPIEKEYNLTDLIKWHTNADEWLPLERGTSIRTIQRANKFQNDLKNEAKTMKTLDNYFVGREFKESRKFVAGFEKVQFEIVLEHLSSRLEKLNNKRESQKEFKNMDLADISRLMAVLSYFRLLKTGMFKMEASRIVAQQMGRGPNRSNVIRQWAATKRPLPPPGDDSTLRR